MCLDFLANFQLTKMLAKGGCSRVFAAEHKGKEVAIKVADDTKSKELLLRESRFLHRYRSDCVVETLGIYEICVEGQMCLALVLEKMDGDLRELVRAGGLEEAEARPLFRDLVRAVADLHGKGLAHRDIKPGNVPRAWAKGGRWISLVWLKHIKAGAACLIDAPWACVEERGFGSCGASGERELLARCSTSARPRVWC